MWFGVALALLVIINLVILDYWIFQPKPVVNATPFPTKEIDCLSVCQKYVDDRLASWSPVPVVTVTPQPQTQVAKEKARSTTYISIPSGSTTKTEWEAISGSDFFLSKNDHPGLVGVYLEGSIKLTNSNGVGLVRLYDVTHGIVPAGGELSTSSSTAIFTATGKIYLWEGYNHYQVQLKSTSADTMVFSDGRVKIITEN